MLMVEVKYEPRKQAIIHEYTQYNSAEDLVKTMTVAAPPNASFTPLKWADGVVMQYAALPMNCEAVAKEVIEGRIHWDHVSFAPLNECTTIRTEHAIVSVIDVSSNPTFKAIAKFIKDTWLKTTP